jgi:hypothetical protein
MNFPVKLYDAGRIHLESSTSDLILFYGSAPEVLIDWSTDFLM